MTGADSPSRVQCDGRTVELGLAAIEVQETGVPSAPEAITPATPSRVIPGA